MKNAILLGLVILAAQAAEQVTFEKKRLEIEGHSLSVDVAKSEEQLEHGLMFRKKLGSDEGMLFIYAQEAPRTFWMKNTFIPLSIGFFNRSKELVDVQDMVPVVSEQQVKVPIYKSASPAQYAVEVNRGWFHKNKIKKGARFELHEKARP